MKFEWDNTKALINQKKHGVSFMEAQTVFDDPLACIFDDKWHSEEEQRELIIGQSVQRRLLLVCFTEKNSGIIRLISARQTTTKERYDYENR